MRPVLRVLTWTAILALPGGMLLLPVVLADKLARRRRAAEATPPA